MKWDHTSIMGDEKVGDIVWHRSSESTREMAKIIAIDGKTQAAVRLLTGPQKGEELIAPWGAIEPVSVKMTPDQLEKLRKAIKVNRVIWKLDGAA